MTPSPEQDAICDFVRDSTRNLVVEASPGSGKTTTIGLAARTLPLGRLYIALAFAKANAEDFQKKLPMHVTACTSHSLCLKAIMANASGKCPKVTADKVKFILKDNFPSLPWPLVTTVMKLVSVMKQQATDDLDIEELAYDNNIDVSDSRIVPTARDVLVASDTDTSRLDFDDMLRVATRSTRVRFPNYGLVFVDEAQDTNAIQRALLAKLASRTVVVGDPYQSIYGFRGASHLAMDELKADLDAEVLPLSVSYRCSVAVVDEAKRVLQLERFKEK